MPLSLFDNLGASIQETEHLLNVRRSDYTHLKSRYDAHAAVSPARSTRLNQLARTSNDLMRKKAESRQKIEEERQKLKAYEEARATIAAELETLQADDVEKADLRRQILDLQDEIVSIDDELQTFRQCARKIERRARQGRDARSQRRTEPKVRSPTPETADTIIVLPQRQMNIEVRVPPKPRRANVSAPAPGPAPSTPQECPTHDASESLPGNSGGSCAGTRQLRGSRSCVIPSNGEVQP